MKKRGKEIVQHLCYESLTFDAVFNRIKNLPIVLILAILLSLLAEVIFVNEIDS